MVDTTPNTMNDFIKRECAVWSEDYVFDLLDRGYVPRLLITANGLTKWSWVLDTDSVMCYTESRVQVGPPVPTCSPQAR